MDLPLPTQCKVSLIIFLLRMYLLMVAVITYMCAGLVYGQSSQCQKRDGKSDECISLLKCKPLREQLDKPNKTDQDLFLLSKSLTKLHCGSIRVPFLPKVCCPNPNTGQSVNSPPACNTPDGKPGKCINVVSCPHFKNLLQPPVPQDIISLVQSYRCVGPENYSVCCGPPPTIPGSSCSALVTAFLSDRSSACCGVVQERFSDFSRNILYQHPWAALIDYELKNGSTKTICGGTLISARYVLTAAQCTTGSEVERGTPITVRLGEYDLDEGRDCALVDGVHTECFDAPIGIAIETIITHPKYDPTTKLNDIALIRLKKAAPYTDFIRPVCLPTKNLESSPPDTPLDAVSWFKKGYERLKALSILPFVNLEKCQNSYGHTSDRCKLAKTHICSGGTPGVDIGEGDNGSPLVYAKEGRSELIGIVSVRPKDCIYIGYYGRYTNIYEYIDWIKSHIVA